VTGTKSPQSYQSSQVEIDPARRELRVRGVPAPIGGRAFEIIEILVRQAGELVTTDQLMERVWPGAIVEENTLQVHISAVRKALGAERAMLQNVKGRGYRLLGSWHKSGEPAPGGEAAILAPDASAAANNLLAAGTDLIGRGTALQQLQDFLTAHRVITLTGPGGIGKSRLALEAARHMLAQGQSDVWFVELAPLSNPDLVPSTVANALGLRGLVDVSSEAVARAIGQRKTLLLLDTCEHIIDGVATFAETVMHFCNHATILATSREVLRIEGEYVYRVPPLDVPHEQDTPDNILKSSAVQMFVARTLALHSAFAPDESNLQAIALICQRLDGIPLAVEFAAARAAMLGVSEVASRLDNRFSLLTSGHRTTLPRHQTLRAALDWSYDLLTASEQHLLRHVSVFPAGFTLDAAGAVVRHTFYVAAVVDGIASLVGKSLLVLDSSASDSRWRLLDTIRAYAFDKLLENGEAERALRSRAEYFRDFLMPPGLVSPWEPTREAAVLYRREIDNIRATLDWCFSSTGDALIGAAITAAFFPMWEYLSLTSECRTRTEVALTRLGDNSNDHMQIHLLLAIGRGFALNQTGAREEAVIVLREGLRIAEALGDTISQTYALWGLWHNYCLKGKTRLAQPFAEQFLRLAAENADPPRGLMANRQMAATMAYRGNLLKAHAHVERAAELYRQSQEWPREAWFGWDMSASAQLALARVLALRGFLDQARHLAQTCVERAQSASQTIGLGYALWEAAYPIAILFHDLDAAAKYLTLAIDMAREFENSYFFSTMLECMKGVLLISQGTFEGGVGALRASLATFDEAGGIFQYSSYLGALSEGLAGLGRLDEARTTLDEALARAERDGEEWCIPNLLCIKGKLTLGEAGVLSVHALSAEQCFRDAIDLAQRQGALLWELRGAAHLAHLRLEQKRPDDARQILSPIYGRFTEGFDTPDLRGAKLLLDSLP
jgi:predicted ATPase/DNA-binding winged helix-turn-helix (wHTH) protein